MHIIKFDEPLTKHKMTIQNPSYHVHVVQKMPRSIYANTQWNIACAENVQI